jgi:hypothetical protein
MLKHRVFYFVIVAATTVASLSGFLRGIGDILPNSGFRW